jgi:hypothetical protein
MTQPMAEPAARVRATPPGRVTRAAYALLAVGTVVGVGLIVGIAGALHGGWRVAALALLTPVLVVSLLALWRAARLIAHVTARRTAALSELRAQRVLGALATPDLGDWQARVDRLRLAAGPQLLSVDPATAESAAGQRALHALYDLLGESRPPDTILPLPPRATLAVLAPDGEALMWDLSGLFERADAGDETALDALAELEEHVQQRVRELIREGRS